MIARACFWGMRSLLHGMNQHAVRTPHERMAAGLRSTARALAHRGKYARGSIRTTGGRRVPNEQYAPFSKLSSHKVRLDSSGVLRTALRRPRYRLQRVYPRLSGVVIESGTVQEISSRTMAERPALNFLTSTLGQQCLYISETVCCHICGFQKFWPVNS